MNQLENDFNPENSLQGTLNNKNGKISKKLNEKRQGKQFHRHDKENISDYKRKQKKKRRHKKKTKEKMNSSGSSFKFSDLPESDKNDYNTKEKELSKSIEKQIMNKQKQRIGFNLTFKESIFKQKNETNAKKPVLLDKKIKSKSKEFSYDPTIIGNFEIVKDRKNERILEKSSRLYKQSSPEIEMSLNVKKKSRLIKAKSGNDYNNLVENERKQKLYEKMKSKIKSLGLQTKVNLWQTNELKKESRQIIEEENQNNKNESNSIAQKKEKKIFSKTSIVKKSSKPTINSIKTIHESKKNIILESINSKHQIDLSSRKEKEVEKDKIDQSNVKDQKTIKDIQKEKSKKNRRMEREKARLKEKLNKNRGITLNRETSPKMEKEEQIKKQSLSNSSLFRKKKFKEDNNKNKIEKSNNELKQVSKQERRKQKMMERYKKKLESKKVVLNVENKKESERLIEKKLKKEDSIDVINAKQSKTDLTNDSSNIKKSVKFKRSSYKPPVIEKINITKLYQQSNTNC